MAQTLRDWYRYLERQMHVSLPEPAIPVAPGGPPPNGGNGAPSNTLVAVPQAKPNGGDRRATAPPPRAALEAEARAAAVRRSLGAGPDQHALPMELGPRARGRGGRRPITESREEIIRRLLDPELSLHEAAAVLNLSKATVRRYTDQGRLACLRTEGGQRRFRLSALLGFLDVQSQARGETAG
ncbi:MAG TPA: helix-turn-helix domain-containing protein [bacterium]|nr:helix-turn-helix domain-containing protein [bacterium]